MSENPAGFPEVAMLDDLEESVGRILDIPITKHDAMSPSQAVLPAPPSKVSTQSVSPLPAQSTAAAPVTLSNAPVDPPASTIALQASTARRITRQVTQQLSENSTAQGTRSEESIIASFNPSVSEAELSVAAAPPSTPTPKAKGRGKEKENALASSSKTASPGSPPRASRTMPTLSHASLPYRPGWKASTRTLPMSLRASALRLRDRYRGS
ncbi:hypothetical protein BJ912DRAFT_702170 [Pholiota molesta]|nr:hypothetical protein BJ912DRAFT_702170 [Pholiota molesta]